MSFDEYEAFWLGMHGYGPLSFLLYRALTRSSHEPKVVNGKRKIMGGLLEIDEVKLAEYKKKQAEEEEKKKLEDARKLGRHSVEYLQQQAERKKRLKRD